MPHPVSGPGERAQASPGYRTIQAIRDLARDRGAEFITRPNFPGSHLTVDSLEPLTGARAARDIELTSRHAARDYIRQAREAGHGWEQIGHALGITPNADADQAGLTVAEDTYAAGNPHTDTAIRYGRSFVWRCQSCDQAISDHGLIAGPHDNEIGHAETAAGWPPRSPNGTPAGRPSRDRLRPAISAGLTGEQPPTASSSQGR